jgi:hypothetical protein
MDSSPSLPSKRPAWIIGLIVIVLAFDFAFFWQYQTGAYQSEFGGHPDEAAHVVTGLFVRDALVEAGHYAVDGFHGSPVQRGREFADSYYAHYPKIGLGVWPPFFYLVQSAWTLPFGATRTILLVLMAALAGAVGALVYRALQEEYGILAAGFGAALVLSLPLVRSHYSMMMAETLSTLLMFGAILAFGLFLDRERKSDALWFGVLAALAILTKGTGLALALAAPLALLFVRKFRLLRRPVLWSAVLIVVLVAGPWTWATRNLGKGGWLQPEPSWSFAREALPYYAGKFGLALGLGALLLAGLGLVARLRPAARNQGRWAASGALIIAVIVFQSIAPVGLEARHIIPALPAACMFTIAGLCFAVEWLVGKWRGPSAESPAIRSRMGHVVFGLAAVSLLASLWFSSPRAQKGCSGFAPVAEAMLSEAAPVEVTLVSSDATGEGMFISEVALHEARPGHVIQRASKSLASSTWSGSGYTPAFQKDEDVLAFLLKAKIRYLVLDETVSDDKRREHHDQLLRVVATHAEQFQPVAEAEAWRLGELRTGMIRLYKVSLRN